MAATLKSLDYSVLQQCMHCGMCLPTCPTYDATLRERNSPRGRIALMRSVADGELEITEEFADEMSYCLGCLACQTACPAGVDYATLFETARADIEASGVRKQDVQRSFWRWLTLDFLFTRPRLLRLLGRVLRRYQESGMEALFRRWGFMRLLPAGLRRLEPQTPRMAEKFSDDLIAEREEPEKPKWKVALLTGCVQDLVFPDINRDTADVLLANGCAVYTPSVQPCCGSLQSHNGEPEIAAELARRIIDLLPPGKYDAIITNAGGCGSHLKHYSALLAGDPHYGPLAKEWDAKLKDIHEWLIEIGCRAPLSFPAEDDLTVTYHESCHLSHGQKVKREPRQVLALLPGVKVIELPEASWCCGSAGIYNITQPETSADLLKRKIGHIRSTGAAVLATSNPGCHLQIARGLTEAGMAVEILQPVTLLARAYRREAHSLTQA